MSHPPHILLVEDDVDVRHSLTELLEDEGYRVTTANDGSAALELLRGGARPDLLIADLLMPVMTGAELIKALRADERFARIPVVVFSAASAAAPPEGVRLLRKPIGIEEMLSTLRQLIG